MVRYALVHWAYFALAAGLIGEDAGLPLPGETVLMFASFLAHKTQQLNIAYIIPIGIAAAICGDNLGFLAGRKFGPRLLKWLRAKFHLGDDIAVAEEQIRHRGGATVFWARYIFGLRTVAGPVAGALGMDWKRFLIFNALGAATWVTSVAFVGYGFANEFNNLLDYFEKCSWALSVAIVLGGYWYWRRKKRQYHERQNQLKEGKRPAGR